MHEARSYTVFDSKANAYMEPFFSRNDETATRRFQNMINGDGLFGTFPEDFSLHHSGEFSYETGRHTEQTPVHVCNGLTLKNQTQETTPNV